jgi:hypothetical protein
MRNQHLLDLIAIKIKLSLILHDHPSKQFVQSFSFGFTKDIHQLLASDKSSTLDRESDYSSVG